MLYQRSCLSGLFCYHQLFRPIEKRPATYRQRDIKLKTNITIEVEDSAVYSDFISFLLEKYPLTSTQEIGMSIKYDYSAKQSRGSCANTSQDVKIFRRTSMGVRATHTTSRDKILSIIAHEYQHAVQQDQGFYLESRSRKSYNSINCEIQCDVMAAHYLSTYLNIDIEKAMSISEDCLYAQTRKYILNTPKDLWVSNLPKLKAHK